VAPSNLHSLALSFARWRNKVPPDAVCITAPDVTRDVAAPLGPQHWLQRTAGHEGRVAFVLGAEWWAYDLIDVTARRGTSHADATRRYFVIASSDRHDPEWGADHEYEAATQSWTLSADASEVTRRRLSSLQMKA
jgi:hypothetical protein